MDNKAQASITDSLYFLAIVTGLCVLLFSYSSSYGMSIDSLLSKKYNSDFCTDALRTILYSSTTRNPSEDLYQPDAEIDHLLAYIKEDYHAKKGFSSETMLVLQKKISEVLSPKADYFDYLFTISIPSDEKYIFVLMHISNYSFEEKFENGRFYEVAVRDPDKPKKDLFCGYDSSNPSNNTLSVDDVKGLLAKLSSTVQSSTVVLLTSEDKDLKVQADLIMWTPSSIFAEYNFYGSPWNCIEASSLMP